LDDELELPVAFVVIPNPQLERIKARPVQAQTVEADPGFAGTGNGLEGIDKTSKLNSEGSGFDSVERRARIGKQLFKCIDSRQVECDRVRECWSRCDEQRRE